MPATLPDVNAETYPYDVVQYLLDQTATFTFFASAKPRHAETAILTPDQPQDFFGINGGYGLHLCSDLRVFDALAQVGGSAGALRVHQQAGPPIGQFRCILMFAQFADPSLHWERGLPPPAIYDRWRSQRFALTDPEFSFESAGQFRGLGVGRTYPVRAAGAPQLLMGAVGNLDQGTGVFCARRGSFAMCGTLTRDLAFEGVITCRIPDPDGALRSETDAPVVESTGPQPADTFVLMRGEKKDRSVRTTFGPKPAPDLDSLVTPSQMRAVQFGCEIGGESLRGAMNVGPVIARMNADVHFNLGAPLGAGDRPGPFTTSEVYQFVDSLGNPVGTVHASVEEGISFGLQFPAAPGQPGVRFAGFGRITGGTGPFTGVEGVLTVNSVIGIAPHALSLTHVLQLVDPVGRFRT